MTGYAAIQNPTDWNLKKNMEKLENKGKATSRDNNDFNVHETNPESNIRTVFNIQYIKQLLHLKVDLFDVTYNSL